MIKLIILAVLIILLCLWAYPRVVCPAVPDGYRLQAVLERRPAFHYNGWFYARKQVMLLLNIRTHELITEELRWQLC